ncbi:hypothetical protein HPP92_018697 [Vanilla planifolia]|uniref:Uncharacterized protein n=1 Tax=Vanilla planifolia TaxID=51239 RepID=A0A835QBK5_VANPL|nr:hypothetical protein HPP92_019285 [Vanilla planifolia]KAG0469369.1 hypothetical protein HPP92_018697 [Vanilla planifolia]
MADEERKLTGIRQIVQLKQLLRKWQLVTLEPGLGSESEVDKRLKAVRQSLDSDEESCKSPEPPPDVPKGYVPVYVGLEKRRFVIPTSYLGMPVFRQLLEKAEEEFGFDHKGALTLPCEIEVFKYILQVMESHPQGLVDDEEELIVAEE